MQFWGHDAVKGSWKKFKIIIVSKKVNGFRCHLYNFWKVSKDTYLHFGPSQIAPLSQKLVFKAQFEGAGRPVGVSRGQAPLES